MTSACFIGLIYYAAVFTLAFATGIARVLVVAPRLGPTAAVLLEAPLLVLASWVVARRLLQSRSFSLPQRAAMGATAFTLTMVSEVVLASILRGQDPATWATDVATPLGLIGLAAQVAFGAMPLVVARRRTGAS